MAGYSRAKLAAFEERRTKAVRLASRGRTLEQIMRLSREENWEPAPYNSRQSVHADLTKAWKERAAERHAAADTYIEGELAKLDAMEEETWKVLEALHYVVNQGELVYVYPEEQPEVVKRGWARPKLDDETRHALEEGKRKLEREPLIDKKPVLDAVTVLLKIAERRSKFLGLDAPVKKQVEVTGGPGVPEQLEQLISAIFAGGQGTLTPPAGDIVGAVAGGGPAAPATPSAAGERPAELPPPG